jgi:hypothetical protein
MTTPFKNTKDASISRAVLTVLIVFFCLKGLCSAAAEPPTTEASLVTLPRLINAEVQALGLGAVVRISTVFRRKHYRGYITRIDEDAFEVTDVETLAPNTFKYSVVKQVAGRRLPDPANHRKRGLTSLFNVVSRLGFGP